MTEHELLLGIVDAANAATSGNLIPADAETKHHLEVLREKLANWTQYRIHGNENERPNVRIKTCERCTCPFFFAADGPVKTNNDLVAAPKWIPFELDPISVEQVLPSWILKVDFDGPNPIYRHAPSSTTGQCWVDHRQTCGAKDGPKHRCAPYMRRYKINVERVDREAGDIAKSLRKLSDELGSGT